MVLDFPQKYNIPAYPSRINWCGLLHMLTVQVEVAKFFPVGKLLIPQG